MRQWLIASTLLLAIPAFADEPGGATPGSEDAAKPADATPLDADAVAAKKVLADYLDLVVKKKWDPAKKLVHPKTLEVIAGIKKRMGTENHPMAPQYWAKTDFYLKSYTIGAPTKHRWSTLTFDVKEINYRVQEKGDDDGQQASYVLGKKDGKWVVVDKKNNNSFSDDAIKFDYKGYFDDAVDPPKAAPAESDDKQE